MRLRDWIAPPEISLCAGNDRRREACVASALRLQRLNSLKIRESLLWNQDPDLNYLAVDLADGIPLAGARLEFCDFALRFSRVMRGREVDQRPRIRVI